MELIIAAIAFLVLLWLLTMDIFKPPVKPKKKTSDQELADAVMKVVKSRSEEKK